MAFYRFLKEKENFYDYEATLDEIIVSLGRDVLEKSLGTISSNRRKKKEETQFGRIEIAKSHRFCSKRDSMYRPYLRNLCLFLRQEEIYDRIALLLNKLAHISADSMQIYRCATSSFKSYFYFIGRGITL